MGDNPSTRGLIDTDIGPLRKFTGILDSAPEEEKTWGEEGDPKARKYTVISLNFKDIDILEQVEPYNFATYTITMNKSNRRKSQWGFFSDGQPGDRDIGFNNIADMQYSESQLTPGSADYIMPKDRMDLKDSFGKRIGMVMADSMPDTPTGRPFAPPLYDGRANDGQGGDVPKPTWTVYSIEGIGAAGTGGVTPMEKAKQLLDGKNQTDFNTAVLSDDVVKSDGLLLSSISLPASAPTSFVTTMVQSGEFTVDEAGVYHRTGG